jgi:hypothetical protein
VARVPGYRSRGLGFDSRHYQIFLELAGPERGPLSIVSTTEELLGRNSSGSGLESREYGRVDPLHWPRDTLYPQKLALTSPTSGGRSVGILLSRTKSTEHLYANILITNLKFERNLRSYIFRDITSWMLKINRRFWEKCRFHLHCREMSQWRSSMKEVASQTWGQCMLPLGAKTCNINNFSRSIFVTFTVLPLKCTTFMMK